MDRMRAVLCRARPCLCWLLPAVPTSPHQRAEADTGQCRLDTVEKHRNLNNCSTFRITGCWSLNITLFIDDFVQICSNKCSEEWWSRDYTIYLFVLTTYQKYMKNDNVFKQRESLLSLAWRQFLYISRIVLLVWQILKSYNNKIWSWVMQLFWNSVKVAFHGCGFITSILWLIQSDNTFTLKQFVL